MNQNFDFSYLWRNKTLRIWQAINHLMSNEWCKLFKKKLVISTNLNNPETAPTLGNHFKKPKIHIVWQL